MGDSLSRAAAPDLLHYRPWRGTFRGPDASVWPVARVSLAMIFRRRLFWAYLLFCLRHHHLLF